jgi:hypothetical protein
MTGKTFSREITSPIDLIQDTQSPARNHLKHKTVTLATQQISELQNICQTITAPIETALASRDWWPLTMHWALAGEVPTRAAASGLEVLTVYTPGRWCRRRGGDWDNWLDR